MSVSQPAAVLRGHKFLKIMTLFYDLSFCAFFVSKRVGTFHGGNPILSPNLLYGLMYLSLKSVLHIRIDILGMR